MEGKAMKVTVFGGTGFVGGYLVDELLARGHLPRLLVRPGSEAKLAAAGRCEIISGAIGDTEAVQRSLAGSDAAIYNIGILREQPRRGVTFQALHLDGARLAVDLAVQAGTRRFLLMSANGVRPDGTAYQRTKHQAEEYLQASPLEWTIFRPSVLFGDPRGQMEFATQLYRDIVSRPLPAPLFYPGLLPLRAGSMPMSPLHVGDVARVFVAALERPSTVGRIYPLGGPQVLSWKQILQVIGAATGHRVLGLPAPAWAVRAVAGLLEGQDILPVTRDQIDMLMQGNSCDSSALFRELVIDPIPFDTDHLQYLKQGRR
jgi:uncharacterized protein YbjT (DUF2867 family)